MTSTSTSATSSASQTPDAATVAEATEIFKKYQTALWRWEMRGGSATLPSDLSELIAPPLSVSVQQLLAKQAVDGWRLSSSPTPTLVVRGPLASRVDGSTVALSACVDMHQNHIIGGASNGKAAVAYEYHAYFKRVAGTLRYFDAEHKQVPRC